MVRIEGHWERIETLEDISRVVREYYSHELADELDKLIPEADDENMWKERAEELEEALNEIGRIARFA